MYPSWTCKTDLQSITEASVQLRASAALRQPSLNNHVFLKELRVIKNQFLLKTVHQIILDLSRNLCEREPNCSKFFIRICVETVKCWMSCVLQCHGEKNSLLMRPHWNSKIFGKHLELSLQLQRQQTKYKYYVPFVRTEWTAANSC